MASTAVPAPRGEQNWFSPICGGMDDFWKHQPPPTAAQPEHRPRQRSRRDNGAIWSPVKYAIANIVPQ